MGFFDLKSESTERLPPNDQKAGEIFSRLGYRIADAIADLVDNSVDAGARNVHIRFVRSAAGIHSVVIADDGAGMSDTDTARTSHQPYHWFVTPTVPPVRRTHGTSGEMTPPSRWSCRAHKRPVRMHRALGDARGAGRNRTDEWRICSPLPYHLATAPYEGEAMPAAVRPQGDPGRHGSKPAVAPIG